MSESLTIDWGDVTVMKGGKKKRDKKGTKTFSRELELSERAARAGGKSAEVIAKAVEKGVSAWNDAYADAEKEGDDGPVRKAVEIWAAGAGATMEGLAKAPEAFAKSWDRPLKLKRIKRMMPASGGWL
jgi:hypothetical protein